eukprot:GILJ01005975.1.p1 GENE.GILJ01005975.1~~GILJ01005975.1.p1  ORF type:complete len:329 (-),score=43.42 GILJ01005975.1:198-1118(-)
MESNALWDAKEMLHIFIYDYLKKHNYGRAASILRHESGISVPGDDDEEQVRPSSNDHEDEGFLLESWASFWELFTERATSYRQTESQTARILSTTAMQPLGTNSYLDSPDGQESALMSLQNNMDDQLSDDAPHPDIMPPVDNDGNIKPPWNTMTGCIAWFLSSTGKAMSERQIRDEIKKIMVYLRKSTGQAYSNNAWRDVRKWLQNGHFSKTADNLWLLAVNHDYCDNCRHRKKADSPEDGPLLKCNLCPRSYHAKCASVFVEDIPTGPWACPRHLDQTNNAGTPSSNRPKRKREDGQEESDDDLL